MAVAPIIVRIQDLFAEWRELGSLSLPNGAELVGRQSDDDSSWMHVLFRPLDTTQVDALESDIGRRLPASLRAFYRGCGGMTVFSGMFAVHGYRNPAETPGLRGPEPESIQALNQLVDGFEWMDPSAIAFAVNGWDNSVHVVGMGSTASEVVRIDLYSGKVVERHENIFSCVEDRLYRIDTANF